MNLEAVGAVSKPGERSWDSKDGLLYALGVGAGQLDPTGFELEFTTENSSASGIEQKILPTFPVIIGMGAGQMPSFGDINWAMLVHGEQKIEVFGPIPVEGTVISTTRIVGIYDKGSGALAVMETESKYKDSGKPAFNTRFSALRNLIRHEEKATEWRALLAGLFSANPFIGLAVIVSAPVVLWVEKFHGITNDVRSLSEKTTLSNYPIDPKAIIQLPTEPGQFEQLINKYAALPANSNDRELLVNMARDYDFRSRADIALSLKGWFMWAATWGNMALEDAARKAGV